MYIEYIYYLNIHIIITSGTNYNGQVSLGIIMNQQEAWVQAIDTFLSIQEAISKNVRDTSEGFIERRKTHLSSDIKGQREIDLIAKTLDADLINIREERQAYINNILSNVEIVTTAKSEKLTKFSKEISKKAHKFLNSSTIYSVKK